MTVKNQKDKSENFPSNDQIIEKYLKRYKHSKQSIATRKSALNYFFGTSKEEYFNYKGFVFEISKKDLLDYFDYLNQLETISLSTKRIKWTLLKSFLDYCGDYYEDDYDFIIKFPNRLVKWKPTHKEPKSNSDVFLTIDEIQKILNWLKENNFTYYIIVRIFIESGPRKGELINIDYDKVFLKNRYFDTKGKRGRKAYYCSKELRDLLESFIEERKLLKADTKSLFLSSHLKRFSNRAFNDYLKKIMPKIGITKNVTCQVFRRSLNALRFEMGCTDTILRTLLNQAVAGVNFNNYMRKSLDYEKFLNYYDTWYPFKNIQF
ncbi:hypothetical protein LCGC14_1175010 [marine sediment metagenome]|uniref:Tyr recombinase domain-containing protein n=1 Tax=marine sediment metagenome TaxID=412755 RepID=A0A0F9MBN7_9ZZZZ|nr:hypothetical protein [bacterium]